VWIKDTMYLEALRVGSDGLMKKDDELKLQAQKIMDARSKLVIDSDLGIDFDDIDEMIAYYSERNLGILTEHEKLNIRLGAGFLPATLSVILAAQGIGKSLLMTDLVSGMIKDGKNVLLVSLEMIDKEVMKRVHANAMELPINSLLDLNKTPEQLAIIEKERSIMDKEQIMTAYNKMKSSGTCGKFFIKDYPSNAFSPLMLENLVESYRMEKGIEFDIIFLDYLGIMKSDLVSPNVGLYSYVKSIGEETRAVAKKLAVPIVSASQLNRGSINNTTDTDNSNISDSIGTAMTADFMMFLLQNEEMKAANEIVCKVTKNRFTGLTDSWNMGIDYRYMKFNDLLVQGTSEATMKMEKTARENLNSTAKIDDDFGIITAKKQKDSEEFAKNEVKNIVDTDHEKVKESDEKSGILADPFESQQDAIYRELGLL
jgi:replicative DNA helicase